MSQISYSQYQDIQLSSSMMTFKEYNMKFIGIKDPQLANGWGWFVDIESNLESIKHRQNNYFRYKPLVNVSMPETIKEYPSIRSMKSMKNLHDKSLMFQIDEDDDKKHRTNKKCSSIIGHSVGVIALFICCYIISF